MNLLCRIIRLLKLTPTESSLKLRLMLCRIIGAVGYVEMEFKRQKICKRSQEFLGKQKVIGIAISNHEFSRLTNHYCLFINSLSSSNSYYQHRYGDSPFLLAIASKTESIA